MCCEVPLRLCVLASASAANGQNQITCFSEKKLNILDHPINSSQNKKNKNRLNSSFFFIWLGFQKHRLERNFSKSSYGHWKKLRMDKKSYLAVLLRELSRCQNKIREHNNIYGIPKISLAGITYHEWIRDIFFKLKVTAYNFQVWI